MIQGKTVEPRQIKQPKNETRYKVILEAEKIDNGICPPYTKGLKVVWYGGLLNKEESDALCTPMLCTFAPFWRALSKGKIPKELGMTTDNADPNIGYFTCHVCPVNSTPPRQSHANALFKVTTRPITEDEVKAGKTKAHGPMAERIAELRKRGLWYPPYWPIEKKRG